MPRVSAALVRLPSCTLRAFWIIIFSSSESGISVSSAPGPHSFPRVEDYAPGIQAGNRI